MVYVSGAAKVGDGIVPGLCLALTCSNITWSSPHYTLKIETLRGKLWIVNDHEEGKPLISLSTVVLRAIAMGRFATRTWVTAFYN